MFFTSENVEKQSGSGIGAECGTARPMWERVKMVFLFLCVCTMSHHIQTKTLGLVKQEQKTHHFTFVEWVPDSNLCGVLCDVHIDSATQDRTHPRKRG